MFVLMKGTPAAETGGGLLPIKAWSFLFVCFFAAAYIKDFLFIYSYLRPTRSPKPEAIKRRCDPPEK